MSSVRRTLKVLATLLPLGALGVSSALAAAPGKPIVPTESADAGQPVSPNGCRRSATPCRK